MHEDKLAAFLSFLFKSERKRLAVPKKRLKQLINIISKKTTRVKKDKKEKI